jgi:hypothetical protein
MVVNTLQMAHRTNTAEDADNSHEIQCAHKRHSYLLSK